MLPARSGHDRRSLCHRGRRIRGSLPPRRTLCWYGAALSFDTGICSSGDFYALICGICSLRVL
jgi:hypothetical protein